MPLSLEPLGTFSMFAIVVPNPQTSSTGLGRVVLRLLGFRPAGQPFRQTGAAPPRLGTEGPHQLIVRCCLGLVPLSGLSSAGPRPPLLEAYPLVGFDFAAIGALRNGIGRCHRFRRQREGALQRLMSHDELPFRRCSRSDRRPCMRFRTVRKTPAGLYRRVPMPDRYVRRDLSRCLLFF